jgi:hypothetical protein
VEQLEDALEEKDRELREVSILRGEYVHQLNQIRNLLKKASLASEEDSLTHSHSEQSTLEVVEPKTDTAAKAQAQGRKTKEIKPQEAKKASPKMNLKKKLELIEALEPEKMDMSEADSYRERMILMNRIDIYRLFITVIIISGVIKYPRELTNVEERELKMFIDELNEFENMVLDVNINENEIWEKGKTCEKQILQLFTHFFKYK